MALRLDTLWRDPSYVANQFVETGVGYDYRLGPELRALVDVSIGRIAKKESRRDIDWHRRQSNAVTSHIVDWLISAMETNAPWLSNVDEHGRPKKLMKFGTLEAMYAEADRHMRRLLSSQISRPRVELGQADEESFADEGGEFYLVRMKTANALDNESNAMRHCVGHGAYDRRLSDAGFLLLSLRDRKGWPHMTLQIVNGVVVQARGKANSAPKQEHAAAAHRLLDIWGYFGCSTQHLLRFIENPVSYDWA